MARDGPDSFPDLFEQLRRGENAALAEVFDRYAERLVALARSRLDGRLRRRLDAEDVLQSVLRTFFVRVAGGQLALRDWDGLWGLLVCITVRKCARAHRHNRAARRDVGREAASLARREESDGDWNFIGRGPGPDDEVLLQETLEQAVGGLTDQESEAVILSLQGHSPAEVGPQVGCSERKVYRVLDHVRKRLQRLRDQDSP